MTDFDFEILEAIAQYSGKGVSCQELEQKHFKGYDLTYNLGELSKIPLDRVKFPNGQTIKVGVINFACLKTCKVELGPDFPTGGYVTYYSLTDKGRALLQNWQRRRKEKRATERGRNIATHFLSAVIGIGASIVATLICHKFLDL